MVFLMFYFSSVVQWLDNSDHSARVLSAMSAPSVPDSLGYTSRAALFGDSPSGSAFLEGLTAREKIKLSHAVKADHDKLAANEEKAKKKARKKAEKKAEKKKANKKRKKAMKAMLQRTRAEAVESFKQSKAGRMWVKQQAKVLCNDWKKQQQLNLVVARAKNAMLEYVKGGCLEEQNLVKEFITKATEFRRWHQGHLTHQEFITTAD